MFSSDIQRKESSSCPTSTNEKPARKTRMPRRIPFRSSATEGMLQSMKGEQEARTFPRAKLFVVTPEKKSDEETQEVVKQIPLKKTFRKPPQQTIVKASFLGEIREAAHQKELHRIGTLQRKSLERSHQTAFDLPLVAGSRNPVARLPEVHYLPAEKAQNLRLFSFDPSWEVISPMIVDAFNYTGIEEEIVSELDIFLSTAENLYKQEKGTHQDKFRMVLECLEEKIAHLSLSFSETELTPFFKLQACLNKVDKGVTEGLAHHYNREELISHLASLKTYIREKSPLNVVLSDSQPHFYEDLGLTEGQITAVIQELRISPEYVDGAYLTLLFDRNQFPKEIQLSISGSLQGYISYCDLAALNKDCMHVEDIQKGVPGSRHSDRAGFVVKTGDENIREYLAQQLLTSLGLGDHVVTKAKGVLPVTLNKATDSKGLIGGKWLTDAKTLSHRQVKKLLEAQWALEQKRNALRFLQACALSLNTNGPLSSRICADLMHLGINTRVHPSALGNALRLAQSDHIRAIKKLGVMVEKLELSLIDGLDLMQEAMQKARDEIEIADARGDKGARKEILWRLEETRQFLRKNFEEVLQEHALMDLLFCSYDSHLSQYLIKDGIPLCVDYARLLPPSHFYKKNGETRVAFRSVFFDFPSSKRPLSEAMIKKILDWDVEKLEKSYREKGLIGDLKEFKEENEQMKIIVEHHLELNQLLALANQTRDVHTLGRIRDKCHQLREQYDLAFEGSILDQANQARDFLKKRRSEICSRPFTQIHPKAFENFKARLIQLQDYVLKTRKSKRSKPTVHGAFRLLYPDVAPFMQALSRWEAQPGSHISIIRDPATGKLGTRSLEEIVARAQVTGSLISEEDAGKLVIDSKQIQVEAIPSYELALTMSLS